MSVNWFSIGSDNGLSAIRRQAIIWTNTELWLIVPLGSNVSEILTKIQNFSFPKIHQKISSAKRRPFCQGGRWVNASARRNLGTHSTNSLWAEDGNLEEIPSALIWILMTRSGHNFARHGSLAVVACANLWLVWLISFHVTATKTLILKVRGPSYLGLTRSISWLLMPWLLTSPGHQQPWYWLCRICRSWSSLGKDFKNLCQINVEEWHKMQIYVYVPSEKFST